jgi:hypothetical protein
MTAIVYEWSGEDGNSVTITQSGRSSRQQYIMEDKPAVYLVRFDCRDSRLSRILYHGLEWYEAEKAASSKVMELEASLFA